MRLTRALGSTSGYLPNVQVANAGWSWVFSSGYEHGLDTKIAYNVCEVLKYVIFHVIHVIWIDDRGVDVNRLGFVGSPQRFPENVRRPKLGTGRPLPLPVCYLPVFVTNLHLYRSRRW
jgi:hypothetical protein